jgi:DNA-binding MarR family transcriptional regulator
MSNNNDDLGSYFRNERHNALVNVMLSSNWLLNRLDEFLQREDITPQQYNILRILKTSQKPLSTSHIREQMMDKMSDTSRIVVRLLKKQLVEKRMDIADKRLVAISLTEKGEELLERLDKQNEVMDAIPTLTIEQVSKLNNLLDKLRKKKN